MLLDEYDTRVWRDIHHYVECARDEADHSAVEQVTADKTASRRGHNCNSAFFDLQAKRLLYGVEGRGMGAVVAFSESPQAHGGDLEVIEQVCCDNSPAYIQGMDTHFPDA